MCINVTTLKFLCHVQNNITIVTEWIANEVSSTKIRRALRRGESVKYLIPETVIRFAKEYNVYPDFSEK
jgi:nicotinic acid mononucleotide adenylyltransferase